MLITVLCINMFSEFTAIPDSVMDILNKKVSYHKQITHQHPWFTKNFGQGVSVVNPVKISFHLV